MKAVKYCLEKFRPVPGSYMYLINKLLLLLLLFQSCLTLCDPIDCSPLGSSVPGIPGKNTGVGCHFLLQCMKVKSESEVAQSCPTLSDPMDWSLPGSSVHGIFQARVLEWGAIAFSGSVHWGSITSLVQGARCSKFNSGKNKVVVRPQV